jgi:hypothetical protein
MNIKKVKVKLSLCMPHTHTHTQNEESKYSSTHFKLYNRWEWSPSCTVRLNPGERAPRDRMDVIMFIKKLVLLPVIETQFLGCLTCSHVTTRTVRCNYTYYEVLTVSIAQCETDRVNILRNHASILLASASKDSSISFFRTIHELLRISVYIRKLKRR